ncbi:Hypothetical protein Cp106_1432 [Corynebacterium pseudotuberculosis 1/06-A]|nr:Hypothetical protein Cp106_1432 [Corynebacterium pseudotuberculosis 1/06-A]
MCHRSLIGSFEMELFVEESTFPAHTYNNGGMCNTYIPHSSQCYC